MAFDLNQYVTSGGSNVGSDQTSVQAAIDAIKANTRFFASLGNTSPVKDWAVKAQSLLSRGDIAGAADALKGKGSAVSMSKIQEKYNYNLNDATKKLESAQENLANAADKFGQDPSKWVANGADAGTVRYLQSLQEKVNKAAGDIQRAGFPTPSNLISKDASGNWVPTSVAQSNATQTAPVGSAFVDSSSNSISFKDGLTQKQKEELTALSKKPASQWTSQDKANWAYGTNNSPIPGSQGSSTPPAGATLISGPSGLQGLTESQIWRDPNSDKIYRLAPGSSPLATPAASGGGTTSQTSPTTGSQTGGAFDVNAASQRLQAAGIDVSGLSPDQIQTLDAGLAVFQSTAETGATLPQNFTAADWANFQKQAESVTDPNFAARLKEGTANMSQAVSYYTGEALTEEQKNQVLFAQQKQAQDEAMAASNLVRSGVRNLADQQLRQQQKGIVESGRRNLSNTLYGLGSTFETAFGTNALNALGLPAYTSPAYSNLGLGSSSISYTPMGGIEGTESSDKAAAISAQKAQIAQNEWDTRMTLAGFTPSKYQSQTPSAPSLT